MIKLNPFAISGLLIVSTCLPLFLFTLLRGKTKTTFLFSLNLLSLLVWGIGAFLVGTNRNPDAGLAVGKFACTAVTFIPVFLYHAISVLTKKVSKFVLLSIYAQALYFLFAFLTERLGSDIRLVFNSFYYHKGDSLYFAYFLIWITIVLAAHLKLLSYYRHSYPHQKKQILCLIVAIPIGFGGGALNFLPIFGIDIYPYGNFLVPFYAIILGYAILKHQLLDISIVIKKSVIYSIWVTLISILYLLTVFLLEKFAQGVFGYRSLVISIFTAFGLGLIFVPLRRRIQNFVDRYFFKGTQQEIALQNAQLRQEVAQSDKYKTLSTLASGVAHEIKNPLTSIQTFCEYLPRKLDDKAFLLKFSDLVGREVDRIDGMVHELLDYSKPAPLALKKIDVNKLIQDTLNTLNSQFIKNRIDVVVTKSQGHTPPAKTPLLDIDANRIKQALLNVLLNAVEAMPKGGRLTVSSFVDRTSHIVTIADTGSGIPPEDLKRIFDPFFSRKDNGTGLGLAIVQGIVEQHKGKIKIESKVGIGTTVVLEFPLEHEN